MNKLNEDELRGLIAGVLIVIAAVIVGLLLR
jgi:hypothetical protein